MTRVDAHLDLRPEINGLGHSGSPFRQAMEHSPFRLFGSNYVCIGAQPHSVSRAHLRYLLDRGGAVRWADEVRGALAGEFARACERLAGAGCQAYVTTDADVPIHLLVSASQVDLHARRRRESIASRGLGNCGSPAHRT